MCVYNLVFLVDEKLTVIGVKHSDLHTVGINGVDSPKIIPVSMIHTVSYLELS